MSNIEWTEETWQVTAGCSKVSAGCAHCYAETMAKRLAGMARKDEAAGRDPKGKRPYLHVLNDKGRWNGKVLPLPENLTIPLKRKKSTTYFVNSMSDLFHEAVPFEFINKVWAVMLAASQHTFQVLTKRPERMVKFFAGRHHPWNASSGPDTPAPNVWLGTSVENQKAADERIPHLLKCPAAVRFLSVEPLLGPVDLSAFMGGPYVGLPGDVVHPNYNAGLHWVIVGGESGAGARPCRVEWIRSVVRQCKAAGVPVFVKQLGALVIEDEQRWRDRSNFGRTRLLSCNKAKHAPAGTVAWSMQHSKGGDPAEWPEDLRVREMPREVAPTGGEAA